MNIQLKVQVVTQLQRKDPRLPVYVLVPGHYVQPLELSGTTVIEGTANGFHFGRRTIKAWGKGRDDWFIEFPAQFSKLARLNVGDTVVLEVQLADSSIPKELEIVFSSSKSLRNAWLALSDRQRRDACEHLRAAKTQATRERRAASIVGVLVVKVRP